MSRSIDEIVQFCELLEPTADDDYAEGYKQALRNVLLFIENQKTDLIHINKWLGIISPTALQEKLGKS